MKRILLALAALIIAVPSYAQNSGTFPAGGGGGTPGGSNTQVQYNNSSAFGGITGATTNGTALTLVAPVLGTPASGTLTNATGLPAAGVVGTAAVLGANSLTGIQTLTLAPAANTSADGFSLTDTTAATSGNQQFSPRLRLTGQGWKTTATAASQATDWIIENQPVQGTTVPFNSIVISGQVNGLGYVPMLTLKQGDAQFTNYPVLSLYNGSSSFSTIQFGGLNGNNFYSAAINYGQNAGFTFYSGGNSLTNPIQSNLYVSTGRLGLDSAAALSWGNNYTTTYDTFLTRPAAATIQYGNAAAAAPVAQTIVSQGSRVGTDTDTAGGNFTIKSGVGTGAATPSVLALNSWVAVGSGSTTQTDTATIQLTAGLVKLPNIASDATHTDASICEDTTTHALYSGSGTLGICLGTSGRQFKTDLVPMKAGIKEIAALDLWNYRYKPGWGDGGKRVQYGPTAQDVEKVLPDLVGYNEKGEAINYDSGALLLIALHAIQEQQIQIDALLHAK
jgi:hypothetical protein